MAGRASLLVEFVEPVLRHDNFLFVPFVAIEEDIINRSMTLQDMRLRDHVEPDSLVKVESSSAHR